MRLLILFISFLISQVADSQIISASPPYRVRASGCGDADANAFITATGITDETIKTAICNLVTELKSENLWDSLTAIYPFVAGTASSHKWNLKDPRDLDAAYRLSFTGGFTHSSNGVDPNGTSGWADTYINIASVIAYNNVSLSYYSSEDVSNDSYGQEFNQNSSYSPTAWLALRLRNSASGNATFTITADNNSYSYTNGQGFFHAFADNSNRITYRNGSSINSVAASGTTLCSCDITIFGNPTVSLWSKAECRYASIGLAIKRADVYNNIIEAFQDELGRGVQ